MDKPTLTLAQSITEQCPSCQSPTTPVVVEQTTPVLLTAAYRCVMCRTDFTSIWQQGWQKQQPSLFDQPSAATANIFDSPARTPIDTPPQNPPAARTDKVCPSCLAALGTPHAMACPYA